VLTPAPPHAVPVGPLAVRWLAYELGPVRAGTRASARVELENVGSATWRSRGVEGVQLAYHWLDPLANPILWDGIRTALPQPVAPGERAELLVDLRVPMPPGDYVLAFDLVHEHRFWFAEVGNTPLEVPASVVRRIDRRALAVRVAEGDPELAAETRAALARQGEEIADGAEATAYLAAGCVPDPDWATRVLDAHEEGFVAVGGSVAVRAGPLERRRYAGLDPWRPGFGRSPEWTLPLVCPSLLEPADVREVLGLPAVDRAGIDGPALCDGRMRVAVAARALRPARRPAS
jgi:hypothetical protein